MSNIPPEAMVRILKSDVRRAIDAGHLPLAAEEIVTRLAAILPVLDEQARTLAAHNAEADEQRDIDRRQARAIGFDPDAHCRPRRVPSAMTLEAERILWEREPDGQGTNDAIAEIVRRVGEGR